MTKCAPGGNPNGDPPRPRRRRALRAVGSVVLILWAASVTSAYVLPVTDIANLTRYIVIQTQTAEHAALQYEEFRVLRKMGRRLSEYIGDLRARYGIHYSDPTRWRTHDSESDRFLFGRAYLAALNYGDSSGQAVANIVRPREPVADLPPAPTPDAWRALVTEAATVEGADALLTSATNQAGKVRFNGRQTYGAIGTFDADALDGDFAESTTAVLDKYSASVLLDLKQKTTRNQLLLTALELAALNTKRGRDADAVTISTRVRHWMAEPPAEGFDEASLVEMRTWRQP
jgi:hypothetical protein